MNHNSDGPLATNETTLAGKVAVVTGADWGLGRTTALRFAERGAFVVAQSGLEGNGEALARAIRDCGGMAVAVQADLDTVAGIGRFYDQLDRLLRAVRGAREFDVLVNNAAVSEGANAEETFDRLFGIHVKALFFTIQAGLSRIRDGGRIINLPFAVPRTNSSETAAHAAARGAVNTLSQHLAACLSSRGITVNAVSARCGNESSRRTKPAFSGMAPRGFSQRPDASELEQVAGVIDFLTSPGGCWVTGAYLEVGVGGIAGLH